MRALAIFLLFFLLPLSVFASSEKISESSRTVSEASASDVNPVPQTSLAAVSSTPSVQTYEDLLKAIRSAQHASEARVEQAVEQEKVKEAWETGKLIVEHVLLHQERAEYGAQVLERLAKDLGMSKRELLYRVEFARTYPIVPTSAQLTWSHYRDLLVIEDDAAREQISKEAEGQKWTIDTLRSEIKKRKLNTQGPDAEEETSGSAPASPSAPVAKPGKVSVYKVIEKDGKKYYDLGFNTYRRLLGNEPAKFKAGNHVFIKAAGPGYKPVAVSVNPADLYTYKAKATEIVDGDTFHADIDLGFGIVISRRLRFLKIDAPEIETAEGKKAKAYLEKLLGFKSSAVSGESSGKSKSADASRLKTQPFPEVLIKVTGEDQHGRPLVQAWVNGKSLEQSLLDEGLAVKING